MESKALSSGRSASEINPKLPPAAFSGYKFAVAQLVKGHTCDFVCTFCDQLLVATSVVCVQN